VVVQHFQAGRNLEQLLDVIDDPAERAALIEEAFGHLSHVAAVDCEPEPACQPPCPTDTAMTSAIIAATSAKVAP
jgi:hypothetical protein